MPNVPDRFAREQQIEDTLTKAFERLIDRIAANPNGVPVDDFQREVSAELIRRLGMTYLASGRQLQKQAQETQDEDGNPILLAALDLAGDARTWAGLAVGALIGHLLTNSVESIAQARLLAAEDFAGLPAGDVRDLTRDAADAIRRRLLRSRLETVFNQERAQKIAVTEVTRANTSGEVNAAERIRRQTDVVAVAFFRTEADERVCPVCSPWHLKHEREWRDLFPAGPALHVMCRCDIIYQFFPVGHPDADAQFARLNPQNRQQLDLPSFV